eukprot:6213218-Pleurochrysis_carterae.AAC.1
MELPCRVGRRERHSAQISLTHTFHKRDATPSLFTSTITTDYDRTRIAREVARSSGQAGERVSGPNTGVKHHHTPQRASGSWDHNSKRAGRSGRTSKAT